MKTTLTKINLTNIKLTSYSFASSLDQCTNLKILDLSHNKYTHIEKLPNSITELKITHNKISSVEKYPSNIEILYLNHNNISKMVNIPSTLTEIHLSFNKLTKFPKFPPSMTNIYISNNCLTSMPIYISYERTCIICIKNLIKEIEPKYRLVFRILSNISNKTRIIFNDNPIYDNVLKFTCMLFELEYEHKLKTTMLNRLSLYFGKTITTNQIYSYTRMINDSIPCSYRILALYLDVPRAVRIIEKWFIECKYNPKYGYCQRRLENEFDELYEEGDKNISGMILNQS